MTTYNYVVISYVRSHVMNSQRRVGSEPDDEATPCIAEHVTNLFASELSRPFRQNSPVGGDQREKGNVSWNKATCSLDRQLSLERQRVQLIDSRDA